MSLFGKTNRYRDNYIVKYVVWPEKETGKPRKEFKYRKKAFNYALSCGPGATISKNEDYCGGSSLGGAEWIVDWAYPYKKGSDIKVYKYDPRRYGKSRRSNSEKKYFGYSYKVYTKMIHISQELWNGKSIESVMPCVKNIFELYKKQGIDFDNPSEWMVETYEGYYNSGTQVLEDIPWSYWSDRCNWGRAYTIYRCFLNTDTGLFEEMENNSYITV